MLYFYFWRFSGSNPNINCQQSPKNESTNREQQQKKNNQIFMYKNGGKMKSFCDDSFPLTNKNFYVCIQKINIKYIYFPAFLVCCI